MATNSDEGTPITDITKSILTGQDLLSRLSSLPDRRGNAFKSDQGRAIDSNYQYFCIDYNVTDF